MDKINKFRIVWEFVCRTNKEERYGCFKALHLPELISIICKTGSFETDKVQVDKLLEYIDLDLVFTAFNAGETVSTNSILLCYLDHPVKLKTCKYILNRLCTNFNIKEHIKRITTHPEVRPDDIPALQKLLSF